MIGAHQNSAATGWDCFLKWKSYQEYQCAECSIKMRSEKPVWKVPLRWNPGPPIIICIYLYKPPGAWNAVKSHLRTVFVVWWSGKRGYEYEEKIYTRPGIWLGEEELGALFISTRLASTIPDKRLKTSLTKFLQQIVSAMFPAHAGMK